MCLVGLFLKGIQIYLGSFNSFFFFSNTQRSKKACCSSNYSHAPSFIQFFFFSISYGNGTKFYGSSFEKIGLSTILEEKAIQKSLK